MSGIDDLLALDIDEAERPWSKSIQDIVRGVRDETLSDDGGIRLLLVTLGGAVMDFEERLNNLEG